MSSFLTMIVMFIVAHGFALVLLFPLELNSEKADQWTIDPMSSLDPMDVRLLVDTIPRAIGTSFSIMMGAFDPAILNEAYSPMLAWAVFVLYVMVVNIVMLNLLIAL